MCFLSFSFTATNASKKLEDTFLNVSTSLRWQIKMINDPHFNMGGAVIDNKSSLNKYWVLTQA